MSRSKILDFYENQSVFITGGTGFMGKVLIEKLLRSTNVSIICVLMRAKKGKTSAQRLEEMFNCAALTNIKIAKSDPFSAL
jgi:fatty acyl-CoA reductase